MGLFGSLKDRIKSLIDRHRRRKQHVDIAQAKPVPTTGISQNFPSLWRPTEHQQQAVVQRKNPAIKTHNRAAVQSAQAATTTGTLQIALENQSSNSNMYAYITGRAIDNNGALFLLQADARTAYYPASPSSTGQPIPVNISIPLGAPGNTVTATIPRIAGGRIWFSQGSPLTFSLNPGPGLVEPSVFNPSDPNYNKNFAFCEFTFNSAQVFVNISYVDYVSNIPVALTLQDTSGGSQHVGGMRANGLATVCQGLRDQTARDGRRWSSLIVQSNGRDLRALSPNSGITVNPDWFATYWTDYVNQVYAKYRNEDLIVDTQTSWGEVRGRVDNAGNLNFGDGGVFPKPNAKDVFGNNTGPFATGGNAKTNGIIPRIAAAFARSTLLLSNEAPNGTTPSQYYQNPTTNHYSRIVHAANVDGLGYAFPYDDVTPDGGKPQEGAIYSFSPTRLIVTAGGNNAYAA
ncbi:Putative beta-1,3-glucanase, Osmotin/thaumatin-like superfamily, glucan endo-1,3-beta-glucosidase [Septoria linicola]|uniref:Beta-1,3-glucanase, Osmotin/thaumatin-like superfamily, glucan endo-1,3-beta-glucosidase n=1 Tax=Septoria linicola TaxID=215465 RepID=A0A9Q9AL62_9PEZI|nr:putative beta-1,3-glucanase, Osmotin/thaumatin-like superfamily, glucan endo-1,3-beta-glucosidase [Septoria linicola]USW47976.1 Putative beta-1,3-glucanase, Osmotin/thaumatin-like superfamily, glucan endo-1,3-beta-glucosidase [Septoria linicola]